MCYLLLSVTLLASSTLASTIPPLPAKSARWIGVPRTLLDPDSLKRNNLDAREPAPADAVGFTPLEKKDIFARQSDCLATEVACSGNKCCPSGYNCYYYGSQTGCCTVGTTCSGAPIGCADPNSLECPASIGGCCPIGQACYLDSQGIARCDSAGIYSSSSVPSTISTYSLPPTAYIQNTTTIHPAIITPSTTLTYATPPATPSATPPTTSSTTHVQNTTTIHPAIITPSPPATPLFPPTTTLGGNIAGSPGPLTVTFATSGAGKNLVISPVASTLILITSCLAILA